MWTKKMLKSMIHSEQVSGSSHKDILIELGIQLLVAMEVVEVAEKVYNTNAETLDEWGDLGKALQRWNEFGGDK